MTTGQSLRDGVAEPDLAVGDGTLAPPPGAGVVARLLAPLREPAFALYFAGQLLSQIGNGIYFVALPFVVLNQGGGPVRLGVVLAGNGFARLAMFPVGGWLVDRFGARRVMLVTDVLQAAAVTGFALLSLLDPIPLAALIAFAVPAGALAGLFLPASLAVLPQPRWATGSKRMSTCTRSAAGWPLPIATSCATASASFTAAACSPAAARGSGFLRQMAG